MPLSIPNIITIAKISQYLATIDAAKGTMFGPRKAPNTAQVLYCERKSVEWLYNLDPTADSLPLTANYLYSLCRGYNLKAQSISGSGGSVAPVNPGNAPSPLQFIVAASGTTFIDGQSSAILTSFIGFNLLLARGGVPQSDVTTEPMYYTWNKTTAQLSVSIAAYTGELWQIYPV